MELTINAKMLAAAVNTVAAVAETRTSIPILGNLLLRASENGLTVEANNLEVCMRIRVPCNVKAEGAVTVPARKWSGYVSALPDADITLKDQKNCWLQMLCGRSKTKIAGMSPETFPETPASKDQRWTATLPAKALKRCLEIVNIAISTEESRFTLNGCLFEASEAGLVLVSTDGHRMAKTEAKVTELTGEPGTGILPRTGLLHVVRACGENLDKPVRVSIDSNAFSFQVGDVSIICRRLTGNFPDYSRVMPNGEHNRVASLPVDQAIGALKRILPFSDERSQAVRLSWGSGEDLRIHAMQADVGECEEQVTCELGGEPLAIGLNGKYLVEFLSVSKTETVELRLKNESSAVDVHASDARYVVMPMRL